MPPPRVADGTDPQLGELAEQLDAEGWAAELIDHRWRLVWVSRELLAMYGEPDAEQMGYGEHVLGHRARARAGGLITWDSAELWLRTNGPFLLHDAADDAERATAWIHPDGAQILEECEPRPAPPAWTSTFDFARDEFFGRVNYLAERVHRADGGLLGYLFVYTLDVPASTAVLLVRGDRAMHERMAALVRPGQRSAAVVFADLEASAKGGEVLASKSLVETLDQQDASALGLEPTRVVYRSIAEIEGADEKARRDAGSVAITDLR